MLTLEHRSICKSTKKKITHDATPPITTHVLLFPKYIKSSIIYLFSKSPQIKYDRIIYFIDEYNCITQEFLC